MKKTNYVAPQVECIEIEIEGAILSVSGPHGAGTDDMDVLIEW